MPSGTLTTNGNEETVAGYIWTPSGTKGIRFICRTNVTMMPYYTCKTYSSGLWQTRSKFGSLATNTTIKVLLYTSHDYCKIAFCTTDSFGGSAIYEGYNR